MFFKKKKTQNTEPIQPTQNLKNENDQTIKTEANQSYPYGQALDWTVERMALKEKQARAGWTVAKVMGCLLTVVCIVCVVIAVKKEAYPFIVEVDKSNGTTRVIDIRDPQNIPVDEMMDKYWLNLYTLSHESYDYRTLENDHARVRLMSVPEVFTPYDKQYGSDNKKSIQNLLTDKKKIVCNIESVVPNGNGIATVRFTKRLIDTYNNNEEARNSWRATIGYEYNPKFSMDESQRLVNPLGFTVTSYRVDPIIEGAAP